MKIRIRKGYNLATISDCLILFPKNRNNLLGQPVGSTSNLNLQFILVLIINVAHVPVQNILNSTFTISDVTCLSCMIMHTLELHILTYIIPTDVLLYFIICVVLGEEQDT